MRTSRPDRADEGPTRWLLPVVLAIGLGYRIAAFFVLPLAHDEINVVAYGLSRVLLSGSSRELLFETPFTVSNGVTPLWFWLQAIPTALLGLTSKLGLRLLPTLLGLAGVWLAYRAGRLIGGPRTAWLSGLAFASMSLVLYANGRGEFAESLIAPLMLALLLDLMPANGTGPPPLRAALWPGLILFTYVGKGLPVWALYSTYLTLSWLLPRQWHRKGSPEAPVEFPLLRLALLIVLPLIPSLLWLLAAQGVLFEGGGPIFTDIGPVTSVWECIWKLTAGYGTEVKQFMVGGPAAALYVYTDHDVWPVLSLMTIPALMATLRLAAGLAGACRRKERPGIEQALLPLLLTLPLFLLLVIKGAHSSRFHLLYIPVILPYAALAVDDWIGLLESGARKRFLAMGAAATLYVAWTLSWADYLHGGHDWSRFALVMTAALPALVSFALLGSKPSRRPRLGMAMVGILTIIVLASAGSRGVLDWGRRLAWEPELREALPDPIAGLPNAHLQLARFFIQREHWLELARADIGRDDREGWTRARTEVVRRARPLLLESLEQHPDDPATVKEAGVELYQFSPADRTMVVGIWQAYGRRHPDDQEVRGMLGQIGFSQ